MAEDSEVLDWGNEDDIVSLGDEDERLTLEDSALTIQNGLADTLSRVNAPATPTRSLSLSPMEENPQTPDQKTAALTPEPSKPPPTPSSHKLTIPTRLTHALPPKPVTANIPYVPPSDPTIVEATAMASRPNKKVDISGHELKDGSQYDHIGPLPPQWEIRFSRDRPNEFYYYDLRYQVSTWDRPSTSASSATDPPTTLSHDDRHYRPDNKHNSASTRRHEGNGDSSDSRQNRHHSGTAGRSPARGRDRSRSPSPQGRDSRARGNQRQAKRGNKPNRPPKENTASDAPKNDDRHWVPSPPPATQHLSRSMRRQLNRAQNQSNDRTVDTQPEEVSHVTLHNEAGSKGHNRDRDHTYASDNTNNSISATNSTTRLIPSPPPPEDKPIILYQTKVEPRHEDDVSPERERPWTPGPTSDPNLPSQVQRERPSRFGPGIEKANGLPAKPVATPVNLSAGFMHQNEAQAERRVEPDRHFGGPVSHRSPPTNLSPVQTRAPELHLTHPFHGDRERRSPMRSENLTPAPSRKRQPLPPQDKEFREAGRVRPVEPSAQRQRDPPRSRSPPLTLQGREKAGREVDGPPQQHGFNRSYSGREDSRNVGYNQPPPRPRDAVPEYDRGYEQDRPRTRQHGNDQVDQDRNYGMVVDTPPPVHDSRLGYQDRERDPPSKPRAMHQDVGSPAFVSAVPPTSGPPQSTNRYRDRPSPPHLSRSESRQDIDTRPGPPPSAPWQERREERRAEKPYVHPAAREPRARQARASSANSIPIGTRRNFSGVESPASATNPSNVRLEGPLYPPNDVPLQARKHDQEYPRPYQQEPFSEAWAGNSRPPREETYVITPSDDRSHRVDQVDSLPRNPAALLNQPANPSRQQRQSRFSALRNPRLEREQLPDRPPQQKVWLKEYDTSPHGRFSNDSTRDTASPPMSRETSFTSSNWTPPSPNLHEPLLRVMDHPDAPGYHKSLPQTSRMDINAVPTRQVPPVSIPRDVPANPAHERKHPQEAGFSGLPRPPLPPRTNNRRDASFYSPEMRRVPARRASPNGMERSSGSRPKWGIAGIPAHENAHNERPRLLNERISELPPPPIEMPNRGSHKQPQEIHQDNGYNHGEPDPPEVRAFGRMEIRQDSHARQPAKTFEQRLDSTDRALMPRAGSLLSRISHGGNDVPPSPQSLRDRVQTGHKRDRDDMVRSHLPDRPIEADDGDLDAGNRRRKRRRARRGGGP